MVPRQIESKSFFCLDRGSLPAGICFGSQYFRAESVKIAVNYFAVG